MISLEEVMKVLVIFVLRDFTEACSGKLFISLRRVVILRIEVEDVKKTYW